MNKTLSDMLQLKRRFVRSVSLERDARNNSGLDGYLPTPSAQATLARIASAIENLPLRAVSLTGPYGTGKSAFALYLANQLAQPLADSGQGGFFPILITGGREPLIPALMRALDGAVYGQVSMENQALTAREATERFASVTEELRQKRGYTGLLVIVDELGKFLEFAAQYPEKSDLHVLQELAELAVRSGDNPIFFVTILHQAFDEYAHRLSSIQRAEWQKVQGRFVDIPFGDSTEDVIRLISQAFTATEDTSFAKQRAKIQAEEAEALKILPRGFTEIEEAATVFHTAFGLHPLTLLALPHLFKRFAQSERTLFAFLGDEDPRGFGTFAVDQPATMQYRLDRLFDYVTATIGTSLYSTSSYGKIWSQIQEAVARSEDRGNELDARIVKTVGLLHLLGEMSRLLPSPEVIRFALVDENISHRDVESALERLKQETILVYRSYRNVFRPYAGSDIDVEERLAQARTALGNTVSIHAVAERRLPLAPIVARRHLFKTGTLRFFEVTLCKISDLRKRYLQETTDGNGSLLLCLTSDRSEQKDVVQHTCEITEEAILPEKVIAVCATSDALRDAAFTVEALEWVKENTPELSDDPIAYREWTERRKEALQALAQQWERLLHSNSGIEFIWRGQVVTLLREGYALQKFLSEVFDVAYHQSPILRNELINRRQPSSSAAAARRNLLEAMIKNRQLPRLGIDGFPAERMMYETLLAATGLHAPIDEQEWGFQQTPVNGDPLRIGMVWNEIENFVIAGDLTQKPVNELYKRLQASPYGIAFGVLPILLVTALLCWEDEVLVYENGRLNTQLDAPSVERLLRRPQDFTVHGIRIAGERQVVLERFAKGLLKPTDKVTMVSVVRAIFAQVSKLNQYTRTTSNLGEVAKRLRDTLKEARNPESLLFVQVPAALGVKPFTAYDDDDNVNAFFKAWNTAFSELIGAFNALRDRLDNHLLRAFEIDSLEDIRSRASALEGRVSEPKLIAFVRRLADSNVSHSAWIDSVAAGVVGRTPDTWTDADESRFVAALVGLVSGFRNAELVAFAMETAQEETEKPENEERVAMRLSVATPGGEEDARVIIVPRHRANRAEEAVQRLKTSMKKIFEGHPLEDQFAALGFLLREMLKEAEQGK